MCSTALIAIAKPSRVAAQLCCVDSCISQGEATCTQGMSTCVPAVAGGFFTGWRGIAVAAVAVSAAIIVAVTAVLGSQNSYPRLVPAEAINVNLATSAIVLNFVG